MTTPGHRAGPGAVRVRPATPDDVAQLHRFIVELAVYEREPDAVTGTPEMLARALFGPQPVAEALVAEIDGVAVGSAFFHGTFSTWECLPGIWLEDLYVADGHRGAGVGFALVSRLAELALERGCPRLEWVVLDWNDPALAFYERIGAERLVEWEPFRLQGDALAAVAGGGTAAGGAARPAGAARPEPDQPASLDIPLSAGDDAAGSGVRQPPGTARP